MGNPNPNTSGLKPWQPGQSGNPDGKEPGLSSWSTLVKNLLDDEGLADKLLAHKPGWWAELPHKTAGNAIVIAMVINALGGDVKAATWLRKTGYGDKLDITDSRRNTKPVAIVDMRTGEEMVLVSKQRADIIEGVVVNPKLKKKKSAGKKKPAAKPTKKAVKKPPAKGK